MNRLKKLVRKIIFACVQTLQQSNLLKWGYVLGKILRECTEPFSTPRIVG